MQRMSPEMTPFKLNQNLRASTELSSPSPTYRNEPGQIGWGLDRNHLKDTVNSMF